jgi:hypothetical protein
LERPSDVSSYTSFRGSFSEPRLHLSFETALYYRRLEEGTFRFPTTNDPQARSIEISAQELSLVLWGIDLASVKRQQRYQKAS